MNNQLEEHIHIPRLVIAGTHSGVGKTTIVTGLLGALQRQGYTVQSYKIGPDYIDPGYHRLASGKPSHNLDTWLMPPNKMVEVFIKSARQADMAVIEGVMGLFDGGREGISSTAAIAKKLRAPVVLVIDTRSVGESAAAIALGYKLYDPDVKIAGVILNRLGSAGHEAMIAEALNRINIPILGRIRREEALIAPERHLGLTPVAEHNARNLVSRMADSVAKQVSLPAIAAIARSAPPLALSPVSLDSGTKDVRIGVASDEAFSFYYGESMSILENLGAELVPFSPLNDTDIPLVDGIIFGGGFPEMFRAKLSANQAMRSAIRKAAEDGLPIYAECGGLMYLTREIRGFDGESFPMVGVVPAVCEMQSRLETVGYVEVQAYTANLLCSQDDKLRGHEFHFSRMRPDEPEKFPWAFTFTKVRTGAAYNGGYAWENILASYLHIHFAGNIEAAGRLVDCCRRLKASRKQMEE